MADNFYLVDCVAYTRIVSEEQALTVVQQYKRGEMILEFTDLSGGINYMPSKEFQGAYESSPEIRKYHREHNKMMDAEKGFVE